MKIDQNFLIQNLYLFKGWDKKRSAHMLRHDVLRSMQSIAMNAIGFMLTKNTMHQQYQLINSIVTWQKTVVAKESNAKERKGLQQDCSG